MFETIVKQGVVIALWAKVDKFETQFAIIFSTNWLSAGFYYQQIRTEGDPRKARPKIGLRQAS